MEIIVKKDISHFNRALGKQINSRKQYRDEMKRQGMVSFEQGKEMAERAREKRHKDYTPSDETRRFLSEVKDTADKKGRVKLSGKQISYMEKVGVNFKKPKEMPLEGGFE